MLYIEWVGGSFVLLEAYFFKLCKGEAVVMAHEILLTAQKWTSPFNLTLDFKLRVTALDSPGFTLLNIKFKETLYFLEIL